MSSLFGYNILCCRSHFGKVVDSILLGAHSPCIVKRVCYSMVNQDTRDRCLFILEPISVRDKMGVSGPDFNCSEFNDLIVFLSTY